MKIVLKKFLIDLSIDISMSCELYFYRLPLVGCDESMVFDLLVVLLWLLLVIVGVVVVFLLLLTGLYPG
jgi:hypothetical protein